MVRVADAAAVMAIAVVVMGSLRARVMGATQPHRSSEWLRAGRSICPLLRLCCVLRARVYVRESVVPCACEGAFAASVPRACRRAPVLLCFVRACHCAAGRACGYWLGWGRCCLLERFRASNVQFSFRRLLCNREKELCFRRACPLRAMPVHFVGSAAAITSTMPAGAARTNLRGGMLPWPLAVDQAREWVAPALSGAHGKVGSSISRAASRDHEHRRVASGRVDRCPPHVAGRSSTLHQLPRAVDRCPIRSFRSRSGRCWLTRHRTAHGYSWSPPGHARGDQRQPPASGSCQMTCTDCSHQHASRSRRVVRAEIDRRAALPHGQHPHCGGRSKDRRGGAVERRVDGREVSRVSLGYTEPSQTARFV